MRIIRSVKQMQQLMLKAKMAGKTVGFVPTMGALHEGHLSLIRQAHKENDLTVVSIFVNPAQFGPNEDFKKYPRVFKQDAKLSQKSGADIIFYPKSHEIYPDGYKTYVSVNDLSDCLCGATRPNHFRGVATIVNKLFNIIMPTVAYFGQKDVQQSIIISKLTKDLNSLVKIKVMPTVREKDGLAMSSRNIYLNKQERQDALVLSKSLKLARALINGGLKDANRIILRMKELIKKVHNAKIDYVCIMDREDLRPVTKITDSVLIALAVRIGKTRLIDNMII